MCCVGGRGRGGAIDPKYLCNIRGWGWKRINAEMGNSTRNGLGSSEMSEDLVIARGRWGASIVQYDADALFCIQLVCSLQFTEQYMSKYSFHGSVVYIVQR